MNDFDRFLELQLRQMLDPVVATRPPRQRRLKVVSKPFLAVVPPVAGLGPDAMPVTFAVAPQSQL